MRLRTAIPVLLAALAFAGCATPVHRVRIEATVNPPPAGAPAPQSFWIKSRQNDPRVETLRYHEAIGHIKTALSGRGLYEAPNEAAADMVIEVDYGAAPKRQRVEVEDSRRDAPRRERGTDGDETAIAQAEPDDSPEARGEIMIDVSTFRKHLTLEARQNRAKPASADGPEFLWRVRVENEDESKDLRKYVPILASATIDYIAAETGGEKEVTVDENGKDVAFVKKGL